MHEVMDLPTEPTATAPDGSAVRVLLGIPGRGSMAHFELEPGEVSIAVRHRTVAEIWYVLTGAGEMWLRDADRDAGELVAMSPGTCLTIPVGTEFQFRCLGGGPLAAVAVTMPPWPGAGEAVECVGNPDWSPTVAAGPG